MPEPDATAEIELKFQVPAGRLPALERTLATRTARTLDLRATYFDTADGALARHRLVLRVRREGDRWVQALKGPGDGLMQRLEDEVPLPDAPEAPAPDPARHDGTAAGRLLQRALQAGGALQPLYRTDVQRLRRVLRHQGARIEAALDRGEVRAGEASSPVLELELELLDGPAEALLDLATRWAPRFGLVIDPATKSERARWLLRGRIERPVVRGAEPALAPGLPVAVARSAMLVSVLAHALPNAAAITAGAGVPEHLHQLRVALRRLRTVLRVLGPVAPERDQALAGLFGALGRPRDADVRAALLEPAWAAARAAGLEPPEQSLAEADPASGVLSEPATTALWLQLLALTLARDEALPAWDTVVRTRLRRWLRTARRLAAEWPDLDDEGRHALRRRVKRLRYLLEFARGLLPARRVARELEHLRAVQVALGRWHDGIVARSHLQALPGPAARFADGWLAREVLEAERDCRSTTAAWRVARDGLRGRHFEA